MNPNMNNVGSIDYVNNDWIEDNDFCIARKCSEFPRLSKNFKSQFDKEKPWGNADHPVIFDPKDNPIF